MYITHIEDIEKTVQQDLHYLGILHHQKITQWLQSIGLQDVDDLQGGRTVGMESG